MVRFLREEGINIITKRFDDDIYLFNQGELEPIHENIFSLNTNLNQEFKFVAISDTIFGSKSQQLSILNDILSSFSGFLCKTCNILSIILISL